MTDKVQLQSIKILNSKYRILFTLIIYSIIYCFFYYDKTIAFCMNENLASTKEVPAPQRERRPNNERSIFHDEFLSFLGYTERMQEQRETINMVNEENEQLRRESIQSRLETRRLEERLTEASLEKRDLVEELHDLQYLYDKDANHTRDFDAEQKYKEDMHKIELAQINRRLDIEQKKLSAYQKKCEMLEAEKRLKEERETTVPSLISNLQEHLNIFVEQDKELKERENYLNRVEASLADDRAAFTKEQEDFWDRKIRHEQYLREQKKPNPKVYYDETAQTVTETSEQLMTRYLASLSTPESKQN